MTQNPVAAAWIAADPRPQTHGLPIRTDLAFLAILIILILAALAAGIFCCGWVRRPLKPNGHTPEAIERCKQRRNWICGANAALLYWATALPVVMRQSGGAAVEPYFRTHLFEGFGCAAFLTSAWSLRVEMLPAKMRILYRRSILAIASAALAASSAYAADGTGHIIIYVLGIAGAFGYKFWGEVLDPPDGRETGEEDASSTAPGYPEGAPAPTSVPT